jgi:ABC-type sulfate transport system substrate-binding protein
MDPRLRLLRQRLKQAVLRWRRQKGKVRKAESVAAAERLMLEAETTSVVNRKADVLAEFPVENLDDVLPQSDASSSED